MRLFVAIHPPPEVIEDLVRMQKELLASQPEFSTAEMNRLGKEGIIRPQKLPWKPTDKDQLHITLQFLGSDVTLHEMEGIKNALHAAGKNNPPVPPFELKMIGAGAFPLPARAQVAFAAVKSKELGRLAEEVERALAPLGIKRDKPFAAHITIARCKFPLDAKEWVAEHEGKAWSEKKWRADGFSLMESTPSLGGHEHQRVEEYMLG